MQDEVMFFFYFDSCQFSYVLYDALLYSNEEKDYRGIFLKCWIFTDVCVVR